MSVFPVKCINKWVRICFPFYFTWVEVLWELSFEPRTLNLLSSGRCLCFSKPRGVNPDHRFKNNFGNHSRTYHNPSQTICMMSVSWPTVERTSCIKSPNTYKGACGDPGDLPGSARKANAAVKCLQMQTWLMRTTRLSRDLWNNDFLGGFTDPLGRDTPQVLSPFLQKICSWRFHGD